MCLCLCFGVSVRLAIVSVCLCVCFLICHNVFLSVYLSVTIVIFNRLFEGNKVCKSKWKKYLLEISRDWPTVTGDIRPSNGWISDLAPAGYPVGYLSVNTYLLLPDLSRLWSKYMTEFQKRYWISDRISELIPYIARISKWIPDIASNFGMYTGYLHRISEGISDFWPNFRMDTGYLIEFRKVHRIIGRIQNGYRKSHRISEGLPDIWPKFRIDTGYLTEF